MEVGRQFRPNSLLDPITHKRAGGVTPAVELLLSKHEALSSNPKKPLCINYNLKARNAAIDWVP
jgi:hypothetical protein